MRRNRLLARFGIVSLLPMVILGLVLGRSFQGRIERRTLEIYTAETEAVLSMLMRSLFTASDFEKGLPPKGWHW